jgi:phosphate starvation-inducible PhoH-like protein
MKKDISPSFKSLSTYYKPKTVNQEEYVRCLNDKNTKILFAVGPAGTGKTLLACNNAIRELKDGKIEKIVLTRPVVPVEEEEIGFLPGNINKKMDPWTRPIFDIFLDFYSQKDIDNMLYNNKIEISPLAFMRGRTFKNSYIIADEMQNSSPTQMIMLTTRIGEGSKMIITGDLNQTDRGQQSGLFDFIEKYTRYEKYHNKSDDIRVVRLNNTDIERNPVIVKVLDIYQYKEPNPLKDNKKRAFGDSALIPFDHYYL